VNTWSHRAQLPVGDIWASKHSGGYRPVAVGRGYISISRDGTSPKPLEWPVYGTSLSPSLARLGQEEALAQ